MKALAEEGTYRLGIFGGAFDPPHLAHMALATAAVEQLDLDELRVLPTGHAWHKTRSLTDANHRLAMARLAFGGLPRVCVDDREMHRPGPTFTVDTLREFEQQYPRAQLYLVLGEDQARALTTWHAWQSIIQIAIICVAVRAHNSGSWGGLDDLMELIPGLVCLKMPPLDISSTHIRRAVCDNAGIDGLVFEPVARYIDHHHLYQNT